MLLMQLYLGSETHSSREFIEMFCDMKNALFGFIFNFSFYFTFHVFYSLNSMYRTVGTISILLVACCRSFSIFIIRTDVGYYMNSLSWRYEIKILKNRKEPFRCNSQIAFWNHIFKEIQHLKHSIFQTIFFFIHQFWSTYWH